MAKHLSPLLPIRPEMAAVTRNGPETLARGDCLASSPGFVRTIAALDTLPRIGETMAQRILDYREAQGRFNSIEDLRNVTGIGDKTFAALQDLITV